jgi:hypothetical protein
MWFVLGFVTLVGISVLMAWWRWGVNWSGTPHGAGRYKLATHKGKVQSLRVGIHTGVAFDFELKLESWFDRAAKSIGISVEPQANRRSLDELVYILADDERLVRALRSDRELVERFERIARARIERFRFHRLVCRRGQLWLDFKPEKDPGDSLQVVAWALQELPELAQALPALPAGRERGVDRQFLRAVVLLGLSSGLAINGLAQLVRMAVIGYLPLTVDTAQLWWLAAAVAAALLFALVAVSLALLGRTARAHWVLLEVLLIGGFGVLTTTFAELRDFNMEADGAPAQIHEVTVLGKHVTTHRTRRGGTSHSYYLELSDWNGGAQAVDVQVSSSDYTMHLMGQRLQLRQHPGYFGVRWVESIGDMR